MSSRILLVEDAPANIQMVASILKEQGCQLSVATGGEQALEILERVRPDLILLDVIMPGIDGFETCRRIKASNTWREIPIIFLTARNDTEDIVRGFEAGAVDYVSKPFHAAELVARVRTHLALDTLFRENQRLLLNVLPSSIAERLKKEEGIIAERFEDVSVLFADIVGFTPLSAQLSPSELLNLLNKVFSGFDELVERNRVEKIKTIGDAYMAAGGLPEPDREHLESMAKLALGMLQSIREVQTGFGALSLRIGLHVGAAIAGVIGKRKFIYDIWGDTVNTASRLESHGVAGAVHVSEAVQLRLKDRFSFTERGLTELKGRSAMNTFLLEGAKS
jgi:adenylate cyclase